jgi:hypothetical protein
MKGKLTRSNSVMVCLYFSILRYAADPEEVLHVANAPS